MRTWNAMKLTIGAVVLAAALGGCGESDSAAGGTGGTGGMAVAGAGGTVGAGGTAGSTGAAGTGSSTAGATGRGGSGAAGSTGAAGSAGGSSGVPVACDSLGWTPGDASLCGASKGAYACAGCSLPGPPLGGAEPECLSATAFQSATVLCVRSCADCR